MTAPEIVAAIRRRRLNQELTQKALADLTGTDNECVCNVEKGRRMPYLDLVVAMCDAMDMELIIKCKNK